MAKPKPPKQATDAQARTLLDCYHCPVPFHAVRTRFLGAVASLDPASTPMRALESLWGGHLPTFNNINDVSELMSVLLMGLWDRISQHQDQAVPFHLTRLTVPATLAGLIQMARLREEELQGFRDGLFGDSTELDLPETAHKAVGTLSEIRAMIRGTREVFEDPAKGGSSEDIAISLRQFQEMTEIAEFQMHQAVLSCTRARRHLMAMPPNSPARH